MGVQGGEFRTACWKGHLKVVQVLLTREEIQINQADNDGATPLYMACQEGHSKVVQLLLTIKEIQINQALNDGRTPLWQACLNGHLEVVQVLLTKEGIDTNKDWKETTPLAIAKWKGHTEIVNLLQQHGT